MTRAAILALVVAHYVFAAPVPKMAKKPDETAAVRGKWESVRADYSQKPGAAGAVFRFDADGKGGVTPPPGMGDEIAATYAINPTATPKRFEWTLHGSNAPSIATYELDGDTLRLAFGEAGKQPAVAAPGPGISFYELKRVTANK